VFTVGGDVTVDQDSGPYSAPQATGIDDGDPEVTQALHFNVAINTPVLFAIPPMIAADGTLTFTPAANAVGSASVIVTLTDDDTAGGPALTTASQSFTITLRDTTPPVITLLGQASVTHEAGATYTDAGATATDNFDGDLTSKIVTVNPVDAKTPGTYIVTFDVTDKAGNAAEQVKRTVTVVDTTAPEFATFPDDVIIYCGSDTEPSTTGEPTTTDNASGEVTLTHEDSVQGTCPGLIERSWTATDASSNTVSRVQTIHLVPHNLVTDAAHCVFDLDSVTTDAREFRLIYTVDPASLTTYKLGASNPGRFNYHVIYFGTPGETVDVAVRLPYPFVTVGDTPITVHDGVAVTFNDVGAACLAPGVVASIATGAVNLGDYGEADQFELVIQFSMPDSGVADLAVALEHGFKRTTGYGVNSSGDAIDPASGAVIVPNLASYSFQTITPDGEYSEVLSSWNEFKSNPGVAGLVTWLPDETPAVGLVVELLDARGNLVSQAITDADGFYQIVYKHKGKPATYTVILEGLADSAQEVQLKGNALIEVNFVLVSASE